MKIYTTLDSAEQDNAIKTLRKNLLSYTKRHGYRGPEDKVELSSFKTTKEKQDKLKKYKVFANLYPALVINSGKKEATLEVYKESNPIKIKLKQMSWARKYINENRKGKKPKFVNSTLTAGDIVKIGRASCRERV